jgi:hypothetical protein
MTNSTPLAAKALAPTTAPTTAKAAAKDEGLGFGDLVDALNPLQHLPGVSSVYRHVTGDDISLPARLAGGLLFGGPVGLLGSAAMAAFESLTGDDPLGHVASLVGGTDKDAPAAAGKAHALPSRDIVAAALARNAGTAAPAADTSAATAKAATKELPAPQLLAKLYEMQATQPEGKRSIKL